MNKKHMPIFDAQEAQKHIAQSIKIAAQSKRIPQKELAFMIGVSEANLSRYLSCLRKPDISVLMNISVALGVSLDSLCFGDI